MNHKLVFDLLLLLCSGYALLRGGKPERIGACIILLGSLASALLLSPKITLTSRFSHFELGVFLVDLAAYIASLIMMLRAERFWTIWMSAFLGVELLAHLLAIPDTPKLNLTYAILETVWGYPLVLLPAIATWRHRQRLKLYGTDSSWSASWHRSQGRVPTISPTT